MLIVTLKDGEYITIGDSIRIKVLKTRGADVQLGVNAPQDMAILRNKLVDRNQGARMRDSGINEANRPGDGAPEPGPTQN
jgi:carbon storage regulator